MMKPEHVRVHSSEPRSFPDRSDPPVCGAPVQTLPILASQDRPFVPFADGEVDCPRGAGHERDSGGLVALSEDAQRSVSTLQGEVLDVGCTSFRDAKAIEAEEHSQRGVSAVEALGGEQEGAQLGAVHAVTLVRLDLGPTYDWAGFDGMRPSMCAKR